MEYTEGGGYGPENFFPSSYRLQQQQYQQLQPEYAAQQPAPVPEMYVCTMCSEVLRNMDEVVKLSR